MNSVEEVTRENTWKLQVLPATQLEELFLRCQGAWSGRVGAAIHTLAGVCRRQAVSEGSLSPTVAGNIRTERSRRGGEGSRERERAEKGGGGGSGRFARGKEGIWTHDLEGDRKDIWSHEKECS